MERIINIAKVIRTNWKKSTFAAVLVAYGYNYVDEQLETRKLMREYCQRVSKYGKCALPADAKPKTVTVILNPSANKRKAVKEFEKYCAPILHLAGLCVEVIKTESEGHAKKLMETINNTDAILVAGGDGTLSEVLTGLLRRTNENNKGLVPIGILPVGRHNSIAKTLFPNEGRFERVKTLVDASLAIVEEVTKPVDVMRIEVKSDEDSLEKKPVYAFTRIKWGAFRDAEVQKDSYWYFGSLRNYVTYLFNGYKKGLSWECEAEVNYSPPCKGCVNCVVSQTKEHTKWYHRFSKEHTQMKVVNEVNPECSSTMQKTISTSDLELLTSNAAPERLNYKNSDIPKLMLNVGPKIYGYIEFVKQGWQYENGDKMKVKEVIEARKIDLKPIIKDEKKEVWFSIDNENFEVKPISITLLPKFVKLFCKKQENI